MSEIPVEEKALHEGLVKVFRSMGFVETESHLLAASRVEPEEVQRLLSHGCTHALATRILI